MADLHAYFKSTIKYRNKGGIFRTPRDFARVYGLTKLYEDYRQAKKQMQEYGVVKKNVDSILYPSQSRAREQER